MPEINKIVTTYAPESMKLETFADETKRLSDSIIDLIDKLHEKQFNRMLSPKEFNSKIDEITKEILKFAENGGEKKNES